MSTQEQGPRHDYYRFINQTWLNETEIPEDAASTNISRQIAERIESQLMGIVRQALIEEPNSKLSKFVRSIYHTWNSPRQTEYVVVELIGQLKNIQTKEDAAFMIGRLNRLQSRSPLTIKVLSDAYNTNYSRIQLSEYVLCVPHKHLLEDTKYGKDRDAYREFAKLVGSYFGLDSLDSFVEIEIDAVKYLPTPIEEDDTPNRYNQMTWHEIQAEFPDVPWLTLFKGYGVTEKTLENHALLVTSRKFLQYINNVFKTDLEKMKLWLMGSAVLTMGRFISGEVYQHYFNFYGTALKGAVKPSNVDRIMMTILTTHLPQMLSKPYTEKYVPHRIKDAATDIVHILKKAANRRIRDTEWMSPETQIKAIQKMNKMGFKVAFPTVWRDESRGEDFSDKQMLRNLFSINEKDTQYGIEDVGPHDPYKSVYWDSSTFEVNAFYYPDSNEMTIPAGILNPPFYDSNRSTAWNLGGIGNVIAHEMTHGFDSDGRNHDADGNYAPWFTEEEQVEYEKKSKQIEKLFTVKYMDSVIDGKLTLMENIADLGGVSISLEALRGEMQGKTAAERHKMLKEYFTSYAVSWSNKDRKKKAEIASKSDKHAPPELRVNKILSQFPEFYETYGLKQGDTLWVSPENRVTIW
jgi:predicted metalloendopeptidase